MPFISIVNPATNQVIDEISTDTAESISQKFENAKTAQEKWKGLALDERIRIIRAFQSRLSNQKTLLATDLMREIGKPITQAHSELSAVSSRIDFFVDHTPAVIANKNVSLEQSVVEETIEYEPLGVIANISAWNYPYFVGLNVIIPALLTGNAVLYKPSEHALLSGRHICRLFIESGIDPHLFAMVVGDQNAGHHLLKQPVDGVFFTGSFATGQSILRATKERMIPVQLELGGKDGIYVCEDSDLDFAIPSIAEGAFYNTGQGCCSVERVYVHRSIFDIFVSRFVDEVKKYKIGDPLDSDTFIGPVTRPTQITFLNNQVEESLASGARLILGGKAPAQGNYFPPTIIDAQRLVFKSMHEESFGPIVFIDSVDNDEHAVDQINNSWFGLTSGVYSRDRRRAIEILKKLNTGSVYWNCCDRVSPRLPWSGRKFSGMGVTLSEDGIRAFTKPKAWHLRSQPRTLGE